jgi:hypothetical protein
VSGGAAVAGDPVRVSWQAEAYRFFGQEHRGLFALLDCGAADEKGDRDPFGVLKPGGEVDHDLG